MLSAQPERRIEPGRIAFLDGQSELPMVEVTTAWSVAEIYLNGAHVTQFKKRGEPPLFFMSQCSRFSEGYPIRGGVPIVFPWFGQREGLPHHGFARTKTWEVKEVLSAPDGSVSVRLRLPECPEAYAWPSFTADYIVTVSELLTLQLVVTNNSTEDAFTFENCLHPYFEVGDVTAVSVRGLKGLEYLDQVTNFQPKIETGDPIRIASEVDRIYLNAAGPVEIVDPRLGRSIHIEKQGSSTTVLWNPWIEKAQRMPDFGNDEYERMLCVEPGNVGVNSVQLQPGQSSTMTVRLSTQPLP